MNSDLTENDNTVKAENILNKLMNPNVSISTLYANSESRIPIISLIFFVFGIAIPMYMFFFNLNIYYQITSYGYIKHTGTMNTNSFIMLRYICFGMTFYFLLNCLIVFYLFIRFYNRFKIKEQFNPIGLLFMSIFSVFSLFCNLVPLLVSFSTTPNSTVFMPKFSKTILGLDIIVITIILLYFIYYFTKFRNSTRNISSFFGNVSNKYSSLSKKIFNL